MHQRHIRQYWHSDQLPHFFSKLPQVELEITCGRSPRKRRTIREATYLFGSSRECDLVLVDPQFAEVHGYLLLSPEGVMVRHLGMDPELTVDGRPVESAMLYDNARIRTGPFEFRIHIRPSASTIRESANPAAAIRQDTMGPFAGVNRLRVFCGGDARSEIGAKSPLRPAGVCLASPPAWRHYAELLLSS